MGQVAPLSYLVLRPLYGLIMHPRANQLVIGVGFQQELWPQGSADMVRPRLPLLTL